MENIFEFKDYKSYLQARVGEKSQRRGVKSAMAKALSCQPTYVSQVLYGAANLSLEQAEVLNRFLGHTPDEGDFFFLLVQYERAGSKALRSHFKAKIEEVLQKRLILTERLGTKNTLTGEKQSKYYSSWRYAAIHIAVTIPALQTRDAIAVFFKLPLATVTETLDFLVECGLVTEENARFRTGTTFIRLGNQSHNILKHHANWRQQAIESLDREQLTDLHYSGVFSLSEEDVLLLKNQLMETIKKTTTVVKDSAEEKLYSCCLDFFSLEK